MDAVRTISPERGGLWFLGVWLAGSIAGVIAIGVLHGDADTDPPITALAGSLAVLWSVYLAGMWQATMRDGSGSFRIDHLDDARGRVARPVDLVGLPIGVVCPLVLVPLVYLPLESIWPDTFTEERLEENATSLVDRADGATMLLLVVLVVIGAPIVEELVFRGLLQRPALRSSVPPLLVVVVVGAVFAAIHFRPVEYAGLFAFGVLLGLMAWRTGRLAMPILAHVAFNATGLAAVA